MGESKYKGMDIENLQSQPYEEWQNEDDSFIPDVIRDEGGIDSGSPDYTTQQCWMVAGTFYNSQTAYIRITTK